MWAIGLFEGEGCIALERAGTKKPDHVRNTRLTVVSTDRDVLDRFADVMGCGTVKPCGKANKLGKKPQWAWRLSTQADIRRILKKMMPHLGERRQAQAWLVLDYIERPRLHLPDLKIARVDL